METKTYRMIAAEHDCMVPLVFTSPWSLSATLVIVLNYCVKQNRGLIIRESNHQLYLPNLHLAEVRKSVNLIQLQSCPTDEICAEPKIFPSKDQQSIKNTHSQSNPSLSANFPCIENASSQPVKVGQMTKKCVKDNFVTILSFTLLFPILVVDMQCKPEHWLTLRGVWEPSPSLALESSG